MISFRQQIIVERLLTAAASTSGASIGQTQENLSDVLLGDVGLRYFWLSYLWLA
jgi:hypothetical protein